MLDDYSKYLLSIRDSLVQNGVGFPIEELSTYHDVFRLGCELEELVWFYSVLDVSNSEYKLDDFILPIGSTFRSKVHEMVGRESSKIDNTDDEVIDFFSDDGGDEDSDDAEDGEENKDGEDSGNAEGSEDKSCGDEGIEDDEDLGENSDAKGIGNDSDCSANAPTGSIDTGLSDNCTLSMGSDCENVGEDTTDEGINSEKIDTNSITNIANPVASGTDVCYNIGVKNSSCEVGGSVEKVSSGIVLEDYMPIKRATSEHGVILEDYVSSATEEVGSFDDGEDDFSDWNLEDSEDTNEEGFGTSDDGFADDDAFSDWGLGDSESEGTEVDSDWGDGEDGFSDWNLDNSYTEGINSDDADGFTDDEFSDWNLDDSEEDGTNSDEDDSDSEGVFDTWNLDDSDEDDSDDTAVKPIKKVSFRRSSEYLKSDDELGDWGVVPEENIKKVSFIPSPKKEPVFEPRNPELVAELDTQIKDAEDIMNATSSIFKGSINKVALKMVSSTENDE